MGALPRINRETIAISVILRLKSVELAMQETRAELSAICDQESESMTCDANRVSPAWLPLFALITFIVASSVQAEPLPDWTGKIRSDHPRLFFNADTWPAVRDRALHEENALVRVDQGPSRPLGERS